MNTEYLDYARNALILSAGRNKMNTQRTLYFLLGFTFVAGILLAIYAPSPAPVQEQLTSHLTVLEELQ